MKIPTLTDKMLIDMAKGLQSTTSGSGYGPLYDEKPASLVASNQSKTASQNSSRPSDSEAQAKQNTYLTPRERMFAQITEEYRNEVAKKELPAEQQVPDYTNSSRHSPAIGEKPIRTSSLEKIFGAPTNRSEAQIAVAKTPETPEKTTGKNRQKMR